jgi:hypothetical protein
VTTYTASYMPSTLTESEAGVALTLGIDASQDAAFLSGSVIPSRAFSSAMLALGRVVRMQDAQRVSNRFAYQTWVLGEYVKELPGELRINRAQLPALAARAGDLSADISSLRERAFAEAPTRLFPDARRRYWDWLFEHNMVAWTVLDPIVSVQPLATSFEAFSLDESTYARVTLPHASLRLDQPPRLGTTNIEFSPLLEREFARTRTYRPLHLQVGDASVTVDTGISTAVEERIDVPDSWVRGLAEVQSALTLASVEVQVSSGFVADILAALAARRERVGPRSIVFTLLPGAPVSVLLEPWGIRLTDPTSTFSGAEVREIRVWGRRRLRALIDVLPLCDSVTVRLADSGMPSFWSVDVDGVQLMIGMTGWTAVEWASKARFSSLLPAAHVPEDVLDSVSTLVEERGETSADALISELNLSPQQARAALLTLCRRGRVMFDPEIRVHRWRPLFVGTTVADALASDSELDVGRRLHRDGCVTVMSEAMEGTAFHLDAIVTDAGTEYVVELITDEDAHPTYAHCSCAEFQRHGLRHGPCPHIVASALA